MKMIIKWFFILLAAIIGLALVAIISLYFYTESQFNQQYEIEKDEIGLIAEYSGESEGFDRLLIAFCQECHGSNMAGQVMEEDPLIGIIVAPNLTSGEGGIGTYFTDEDYVRTIRHGLDVSNRSLIVMPSNYFAQLSDDDLSQIISYIKNLPPVDNVLPESRIGLLGRFFMLQDPSLLPASVIDHSAERSSTPEKEVSAEYGEYLAVICALCHGQDFSGGPEASSGLNLTPAGNLSNLTEEEFVTTIRTGVTPEGEVFDPVEMPYEQISLMSDDELRAIWLYLQSLPPIESQLVHPD